MVGNIFRLWRMNVGAQSPELNGSADAFKSRPRGDNLNRYQVLIAGATGQSQQNSSGGKKTCTAGSLSIHRRLLGLANPDENVSAGICNLCNERTESNRSEMQRCQPLTASATTLAKSLTSSSV